MPFGYTGCTMPLIPLIVIGISAFAIIGIILLGRPRRFYFVRHGETLLNAQHIRQGREGALSERGRNQAEKIGQLFKNLHIERIISSTYPRAQETAEIINTHLKVSITCSELLAERRNPSEIVGKSTRDPEVIRIVDQMDLAYHEDEYRFSDEENFVELKERARECLNFLASQNARGSVVVTHHHFLKMFLAYLLYRERLHASDFVKLSFFNFSDNAGITVCDFYPLKTFSPTLGWEVISFNQTP